MFFIEISRSSVFALVRDRSQSPSLSRAYFANNCVKSPFVDAHVRSSKLRLSTGALSRTSSEHCLSAVRRTGVNEFVTPVTQTVAYIGYAPVCGGGAFAYSMRIFPRHDAVSAAGAMRGGRARPLFLVLRGRYASFGNTRSRKMGIFCAIRPNSRILSGAR